MADSDIVTRDVISTRLFDTSPDRVWKAWTESTEVMKWWGPDHFTAPAAKMDVRPGGISLVCMRSPDGQDMWMTWAYTAVEPGKRLEYVQNLADKEGNLIDPGVIGMPPEFPRDVTTVVTLEPEGGKTRMTITEHTTTSEFMMKMSQMGLEQCVDKMDRTFA
jgi:uncharacterized protein YndB with AHSA1/START domain